jgi:hypothetical protein
MWFPALPPVFSVSRTIFFFVRERGARSRVQSEFRPSRWVRVRAFVPPVRPEMQLWLAGTSLRQTGAPPATLVQWPRLTSEAAQSMGNRSRVRWESAR